MRSVFRVRSSLGSTFLVACLSFLFLPQAYVQPPRSPAAIPKALVEYSDVTNDWSESPDFDLQNSVELNATIVDFVLPE
ncbi:MAG: hypothetical protein ACK5ME_10090 [Parahaliea sp.]